MGFWNWLTGNPEARAEDEQDAAAAKTDAEFADFLAALNGSGRVTRAVACDVPGVAGAVEFIAAQAAGVPLKLYQVTADGLKEKRNDRRVRLLNDDTGDLLDGTSMKEALYMDYLYEGNGYLYKSMAGNRVDSLHYVDWNCVAVNKAPEPIYKRAAMSVQGRDYYEFDFVKLCRHTQDGVRGHGILEEQAQTIALAWATQTLQTNLMKGGGNKRGFLSSDKKLTQDALDRLKRSFMRMYSNEESGVVVLNAGVSFKEASNTSVELQLNETSQAVRNAICTALALPPEVITGKATAEQLDIAIRQAVMPLLNKMEAALNRDLLLEREKGKLRWRADTEELLRGDVKKRYEAYKLACEAGWAGRNEIRRREGWPTIDGLDVIGMSLSDVLFDMNSGKYFTPNTKQITDLSAAPGQESTDAGAAVTEAPDAPEAQETPEAPEPDEEDPKGKGSEADGHEDRQ